MQTTNPFVVTTPENLEDKEIVNLFVPYPEYEALQGSGHQFLNGHRGSGKSMMLRMMTPHCQSIEKQCSIEELNYYGVYFSIKTTELYTQEYTRLEKHVSGSVISEHLLCVKVLSALFKSLEKIVTNQLFDNFEKFYRECFCKILLYSGETIDTQRNFGNINDIFNVAISCFDHVQAIISSYIKRSSFQDNILPYNGPLFGFLDVIVPLIDALKLYGIIKNKVVYLLLDDADNLSLTQTKVLNTWVSYRTTATVTLKISTQLNYKTRLTTSEQLIEAPHDYSELYFTSVLTGSPKDNYPKLVSDIVEKRLKSVGFTNILAKDFFPEDEKQAKAIAEIAENIKADWEEKGLGYRPGDDAYRYARPEYIRKLSGQRKSSYNYLYAGFDQLVHMSSGIIRYFLEPAAKMFSEQLKKNNGSPVIQIDPKVQDKLMRAQADDLFINEFHKLSGDATVQKVYGWTNESFQKLHNLIQGLGSIFQAYLMDAEQSQRRIFSFFISEGNEPTQELREILNLGIELGYFYESSVGKKSGYGRTPLYVLTRRIAPVFKLDPIGFSNNLSLQTKQLTDMMDSPSTFVNRIKTKGLSEVMGKEQLNLELK